MTRFIGKSVPDSIPLPQILVSFIIIFFQLHKILRRLFGFILTIPDLCAKETFQQFFLILIIKLILLYLYNGHPFQVWYRRIGIYINIDRHAARRLLHPRILPRCPVDIRKLTDLCTALLFLPGLSQLFFFLPAGTC